MVKQQDLIGLRFHKLVVVELDGNRNGTRYWKCQCDCGSIVYRSTSVLNANRTKSCGGCFIDGPSRNRGPKNGITPYNRIPNDRLFVKGRKFIPSMKARIIQEKLLAYRCQCGNIGEWNGEELVLQLDHIDGDRTNNTLNNFRFLCPNCHTQQVTWGRKRFHKLPSDKELLELAKTKTNAEIATLYDCSPSTVSHKLRKHYR